MANAPALDAPNGLRPCCAFGYNLKVKAWGIPIPFYRIDNIVEASTLGDHRYNDNFWLGTAAVLGIGSEKSGIVYSHKGAFLISPIFVIPQIILIISLAISIPN